MGWNAPNGSIGALAAAGRQVEGMIRARDIKVATIDYLLTHPEEEISLKDILPKNVPSDLPYANTVNTQNTEIRNIAEGSGLTTITQQHGGLLEALNQIITLNNEYYVRAKNRSSVSDAHILQKEGRMPQFDENDLIMIKNGQLTDLSRHGQISRIIYAELIQWFAAEIKLRVKQYNEYRDHMARKPDELDTDLWKIQGSRKNINQVETRELVSGEQVINMHIFQRDARLLDHPQDFLIDTSGNIIEMKWGFSPIQYYLDQKATEAKIGNIQLDTGAAAAGELAA